MRENDAKTGIPKVAVIGSGYWGKNLIRNLDRLGALALICDRDETQLAAFRKQLPGVETCLALSDVLGREDIDALVIATPAETHATIGREALLAGKHVFVEKPMALSNADAADLIELAHKRSRILMVGHLLQYHPAFEKLKQLVSDGDLGRINYIYSHRLNLGKIRREENILWSFAPHDISMILSLAGEEPESVLAVGGNVLHQKIADVTTTHLAFPSGLKAHVFVSWLHPFKEQKLIVVGEKKMAVFDDTCPWPEKLLLFPHEITWKNNIPVPSKAEPEKVELVEAEPLLLECRHFLECIAENRTPRTDGREGLRVLQVLNAAQESLDGGHRAESIEHRVKNRLQNSDIHSQQNTRLLDHSRTHLADNSMPFVHDTAVIDQPAEIGAGTKIWHFSHVLKNSQIGENCTIGQNVAIGPDVSVGDNCKIQNNVSIYNGVTLEDGVFCGPSMVFTNVHNPRAEIRKMDQVRPTRVRQGATIGANATVICGVSIGRYAFIGAGAVVTRDVPDHALAFGNPARIIGWMCRCGERLDEEFSCGACGLCYQREGPDFGCLKLLQNRI